VQEPIYIKIHNRIKRAIEQQKYKVGERIPAERQMAQEFHVSRMTLRQAIKILESEGILERRVGSGTYVASQKVQEKMSGVMSFGQITRANGQVPSSKLISYHISLPLLSEQEKLQISSSEEVLRMRRIRYADGVPICREVVAIPHKLIKNFSKKDISTHLYRTLEKKGGYQIGSVVENIGASLATEQDARFLQTRKGQPLITRRQVTSLADGQPFEYTRAYYVADRFEFTFAK
jgi:GntR family transcriptional regulator